jgi:hypothetical protein
MAVAYVSGTASQTLLHTARPGALCGQRKGGRCDCTAGATQGVPDGAAARVASICPSAHRGCRDIQRPPRRQEPSHWPWLCVPRPTSRRWPLTLHSLFLICTLRLMHPCVQCLEPAQRLAVAVGALVAPLAAAAVEAQRIAMGSRCCAVHAAHHLRVQASVQRRATAKMAQVQNRGQLQPAVVPLLAWQ